MADSPWAYFGRLMDLMIMFGAAVVIYVATLPLAISFYNKMTMGGGDDLSDHRGL